MSQPSLPLPGNGNGEPPIRVRITRVSPIAGALAGGITVTLTGRGFQPDADVYFGTDQSPEVVVLSGINAQAKLPPAAQTGSVDVTIFNPDGTSATLPGGFTYVVTGTGARAEVLGVSPLSVIEDTVTEVTIRGRNLIEAYTNGMLALRGPSRASVAVLSFTSSQDEATGIESLTFTVHITATPPLGPLERMAIQIVASRRPGAATDGVFESSRQMFTVLPRAYPAPLAYSANLQPGNTNLVVVVGRNLEGCSLDLGQGATVHLQRSDDRILSGIVSIPPVAAGAPPPLSVRAADGSEVAQYAMWAAPVEAEAALIATNGSDGGVTGLTLTPVPGQEFIGPTAEDSALFNLNGATSSDLFFDWSDFEITVFEYDLVLNLVHEVHLIPVFDGGSGDTLLGDFPVLAQVGRLFRLRASGILVALHIDLILHISLVLIIGFIFDIWDFGLFNEFPEFDWAIGSVVIGFRFEVVPEFVIAFLLAAVLPDGRLRVLFAINLTIELDFSLSSDGHHLQFGLDYHVNFTRIGPLSNLLLCNGLFQLASDNGQTVFSDAFGGNHSFYLPRSAGECCVPWNFDLQLVSFSEGQPEETVQDSFRADFCLAAAPSPQLGQIIITSEHPDPSGFPPTLEMNIGDDAALIALSVPVDANGVPTGGPQDVRDLGYDVRFFLESPVDDVLDPASLPQGDAFAVQEGENVIHAVLTPRADETPQFTFWPDSILGFDIATPLAEGELPGIIAGALPVLVKGTITVEPTLAYVDAQGQIVSTSEIERYEPFETPQRQYFLAVKVTVPQRGTLPPSLTITVDSATFSQPPLGGIGTIAQDRQLVNDPTRFFTGTLAIRNQQGTLPLSRDMRGDKWIKVPGLTIQANQMESVVNGVLQLVPPGRLVTNRDVKILVGLKAESSKSTVTLVGRPLEWTVVNEETFEEYPRGFVEVQSILSGSGAAITAFRDFARSFYSELKTRAAIPPAADFLKTEGDSLWTLAYQSVQILTPNLDDRPLYWARLQSIAALRAFHRHNNSSVSQTTIDQFELPSRGLDQATGAILFAGTDAAKARKAIVTGFDPFELTGEPDRSNPSGLVALKFNGQTFGLNQPPAYVRTAILPVRYREFDAGWIENAVERSLGQIVLLMTCSENGGRNFYDIERWAGKNRGRFFTDNNRIVAPGSAVQNPANPTQATDVVDPGGRTTGGAQFIETTLPYGRVITPDLTSRRLPGPQDASLTDQTPFVIDQSYRVVATTASTQVDGEYRPEPGDTDQAGFTKVLDVPDQSKLAEWGSGSNFLSNEIFYRTALSRSRLRPSLASGHLHIPGFVKPTTQHPIVLPATTQRERLISGTQTALERFLESLFRLSSSGDITFPRTNVNTTSAPITLTATNDTNETINAFTVDVSPPFFVQWPGPTPIALRPGDSLPLPFTFRPTTPGVQTQTARLRDVNGEVLLTATLTGEGLPTYSITGQITAGGVPLQGVQVTLTGSRTASTTTGTDGRYSFIGLDAGGNYTVTPSRANYTFSPPSQSFNGLAADQSADFTATLKRHRISGHVRTASGTPVPNAAVTLSGAATGTATTDATGTYLFTDLPEGGNYTVTVSRVNYTFATASQTYNNLLDDVSFDFTGALVSYTISGRVTSGSAGLSGVTVTLSGSQSSSMTTDTAGNYSFTVIAEGSYTVIPSKTNYTFAPPSVSFNILNASQTANFAATLNNYRISGRVTTAAGVGLGGVTITLSGSASSTTTTDSTGNYSFANLPANGNYTVTPSRTDYAFTPASSAFNTLSADQISNFTGALVSYTIGGRITSGGTGLAGVTVTLSGSQAATATTDTAGNYSFTVIAEGNYTVTPSKQHYTFTPQSSTFSSLSANQTANFSATLNHHTISGHIASTGVVGLSGVTLTLSGSQSGTTTTNTSGDYSFANLPAGGNYTVTPSKTDYTFTPASRSFNDLGADQTADFVDALVSYTISGHVTSGGTALAGVTVNLSGSKTASTTTDTSGSYSFVVTAEGNYTVTPSKAHYTFAPASASYNNLGANQTADFAATLNTHTISGRVTKSDGTGLGGATVSLSGSQSQSTATDSSGNYSFANLPAGGNYTVTVSRANYTFTPGSSSFNDLGANQTANFTGALVSYTISGHVTAADGTGFGGVTVTLSGSQSSSVTTDASGSYSFTVPAEGNYTVTPSKQHYTFAPQAGTFSNLSTNQTADFTATLNRHAISGRVTTAGGVALPNITLSLSGSQSATTRSDASGDYSFGNLPAGGNYTVTAARANYAFTPGPQSFSDLGANQTANFTGGLVSYTISGHITSGGTGFGGVTVTLSGSQSATATTDASGNYSFTVTAEGNYTITPSKTNYTFMPQSAVFSSLGGNQSADFTATLNHHTISGGVMTADGVGLGVTLTLSGSQSGTATTDASGNYSFANLPAGGDYTVTPSRADYVFTPNSKSFNSLGANQTASFTAALVHYTLSGRVTLNGAGLAGVTVTLGGSETGMATTDASGNYSFTVTAEGNYTVTPSKPHYTFAPQSSNFNNLGGNQTADFAATLNTHTISGRVTKAGGAALPGVTVTLSGSQSATATTDASGNYSFANLPAGGDYTVTLSRANYTFTPDALSFSDLGGDQAADFTGTPVNFTISGKVTSGGTDLSGVTVVLSGLQSAAATTDANGNYSFSVPAEGDYTVAPSDAHYTFTPTGASFHNLTANQAADFSAALNHYTISGRVTAADGTGLAGVTVALSGSQSGTATTDASGNYSFADLSAGGNYTLTAARTNYAFTPDSRQFNDLIGDQRGDFAGSLVSYMISGRVASGATGLGGVTVTLGGSETGTTTTDSTGNYVFVVTAEGDYTVSASEHYAFTPSSASFDNIGANQTADFAAAPNQHNVSGHVKNPVGDPFPNVPLAVSGSQAGVVRTDASGNYSFANLPEGGNYTVTPKLFGYTFASLNHTHYGLSADQAADFTAGPVGGVRVNLALPPEGVVVSVSTMYELNGRTPTAVINGDLRSVEWHDATQDGYPGWLEVAFAGEKTISEVHVFSTQDNLAAIAEQFDEALPFTEHGLQDLDVEYWNGTDWQLVPGGAVRDNNRVWVKVAFPPLRTTKIRVVVRRALGG